MPRMRASTSASSALAHEIGLVQHDDVGEGDLVLGFGRILQPVAQPFGVGDRHHRVEPRMLLHVLVDEEGLRHRRRIGEARGLDDDGVELALALHQPVEDAHQIAAHGAADAAVVHLEHFLVGADDEIVVDADLAELVDDHGVFLAVVLRQDAVQQRGLAGAEIAGQHGDGDFFGRGRFGHGHSGHAVLAQAAPAAGRAPALVGERAGQRLYIVPDHVDVSGRVALFVRQAVRIERPADLGAGFAADPRDQPGIADIFQKNRRDFLPPDLGDDAGDVPRRGLGIGRDALRRNELDPVGGGEIAEGVVGGDDLAPVGGNFRDRRPSPRASSASSLAR